MELTVSEMIQFVQGVEQYYNNAWEKLLIYGAIIAVIATIVIPILIQLWQKKELKIQSKIVKEDLEKKIDEMVKSKFESHTEEYEKKFAILEKAIKRTQDGASGYIFHLAGKVSVNEKDYSNALECYLSSGEDYISIRDDFNLQDVLDTIAEKVMPKLNDYDMIEKSKDRFQRLISSLEKANDRGQYTSYMIKLEKAFKFAKKRLESDNLKK